MLQMEVRVRKTNLLEETHLTFFKKYDQVIKKIQFFKNMTI